MNDSSQLLPDFQPAQEHFVAMDSDGCVFDTTGIKHRECFVPAFIRSFGLQPLAGYAREVWEFVSLGSKTRGTNRFAALSNALNLLAERPEVQARGVEVPSSDDLDLWLASETHHTNATLAAAIEDGRTELRQVLDWSRAVDEAIGSMVVGIPPFPLARETIARLREVADLAVISETPTATVQAEWTEHELATQVSLIAGQELGSKSELLRQIAAGKYAPRHALVIGDAPADFRAARTNHALFYPIIPGHEELCWQRLHDEALDHFLADSYAGAYEDAVLAEFQACLPERPPWQL